jgi:ATP-binding cassette subfamily B protein
VKNVFRLLGFFRELRWRILGVLAVGCVSIILFAFMPIYLNNGFNIIRAWVAGDVLFSVVKVLLLFAILAVFNGLFDIFCSFVIFRAEKEIVTKKVCETKRILDTAPISFVEKYNPGELGRRVAQLLPEMLDTFLNTIYTIVRVCVFCITTAIIMFMINWVLAAVVLLSFPICIFTARFVSKRTQKYFNNNAKASRATYEFINQKFSLQDFYMLHGIASGDESFNAVNDRQRQGIRGAEVATAFNTIYINFIQNFMYLLVTLLFGVLYITQAIPTEFGALPAFVMFSNRFLANAVIVSTATTLYQNITTNFGVVAEIMDCPLNVTQKEHINIAKIKNGIAFKNVTLLQGGDKQLNNVSFKIPQGANVAFVGPSGSGKTYIVDLLFKLAMPSSGTITVDEMNLDEITSKSYFKCVGVSFEQPFIFRGTVAENLLYGVRRELPENVMAVTEMLGSNNFIEQMENGYETMLSDNATILGMGQRQAISVARLVLQNPDIAVFQESLSATDAVLEKNVYEKISKMGKKQTTIFVTHRLTSVENCDIIYYMEHGKIMESGSHAQLMERKGKYYSAFMGSGE